MIIKIKNKTLKYKLSKK